MNIATLHLLTGEPVASVTEPWEMYFETKEETNNFPIHYSAV